MLLEPVFSAGLMVSESPAGMNVFSGSQAGYYFCGLSFILVLLLASLQWLTSPLSLDEKSETGPNISIKTSFMLHTVGGLIPCLSTELIIK